MQQLAEKTWPIALRLAEKDVFTIVRIILSFFMLTSRVIIRDVLIQTLNKMLSGDTKMCL